MVSAASLDEIRLDMSAVAAAADDLRAAAGDVRSAASDGAHSWSTMPAVFEMAGVSAAMPALTHRSTAVATELAESAERLHELVDRASFDFAELQTRRAALAERIASFAGGVQAAVERHDAALPEPPDSSTSWDRVPGLAAEDAALRAAVSDWNEQWRDWQQRLASQIRAITGGDSTAGLAADATDVHTASLVAPMPLPGFPSTPFQFPWPWLGAAGGTAAGSGSAVGGLSALGLLGILFGLSGDTKQQTPADAMRQRMAQADQDAWAWTHDPLTGKPREVAGGAGIMTDVVGPMTGPQADKDIRSRGRLGDSPPHREVDTPEEVVQAWRDLSRGGKVTADSTPERIAVVLPDGTRVQYRRDSKSGGPVVEVQANGAKPLKLHMPKGADPHDLPDDAKPDGLK
ncbi:hypothetical protein DEJ28_05365 [Curtobacterium sp. MCPF17_002]|uniref:hypothetical protein n=1 Tax=Curtobacterium sp. MCPF17_002 TaxID=2175645 RepID=UPI0011B44EF5|nr:hypothetical protein [Curtobacterium sp. MCPF17_002]WIB78529.1 hypothetical protein DEJ28_05365 [Curtobacterium sp. MCPF17_002]